MDKKIFKQAGFTTVELLVTITILAVLSVLIVLVINPVDLLKQGKDSNRIASLNAINGALRFLTENEPGTFIGTSSVVYVSIPDTSPICANLSLPTLPSSWTYNCVTTENLKKIDGTGWIPVNFGLISAGSPISELPVDSKNSVLTRNYFTYVASGSSWELAFSPEATKNKLGGANNLTIKDGGQKASLFELGKDLSLLPVDYGDNSLVGYWDFNEGSGTVAGDKSGSGNSGAFTATQPVWDSNGKIGGALRFSQANQYVYKNLTSSNPTTLSVSFWFNVDNINASYRDMVGITNSDTNRFHLYSGSNELVWYPAPFSGIVPVPGRWYHVAGVYENGTKKVYVDGVLKGSAVAASITFSMMVVGSYGEIFSGKFDDIRYYSRALSGAEVLGLYNSVNQ